MFDGKGRECAIVGQVPHGYYFPIPPIFFRKMTSLTRIFIDVLLNA